MIVDEHDGHVAQTRITVAEAQFLIICIDAKLARGDLLRPAGGVDAGHVRQVLADIVDARG